MSEEFKCPRCDKPLDKMKGGPVWYHHFKKPKSYECHPCTIIWSKFTFGTESIVVDMMERPRNVDIEDWLRRKLIEQRRTQEMMAVS